MTESLGATFSDPLLHLLEGNPEAQRDLLEFRHTLEGSCAYYAALRATSLDHQRLTEAFEALQACYARNDQVSAEEAPPTRASTWRSPRPATTPCCCTPSRACSTCCGATW